VRAYAERAIVNQLDSAQNVRLTQVGEMVLKPGTTPRSFSAIEEFAVDRVAFAWWARFPMLGPISLHVTDSYDGRGGRLEVRLLRLPLQRKRDPELAQGQALRYLAELPWVPQAILSNSQLSWHELDERTVEVATSIGGERVAVRLIFNEAGEITRTLAERPRIEAGNAVTPWIGEYAEYREFAGVRLPARGEVRWELPDGPFTYWRGTITSLKLCD
jgi:hypothetical protein